MKAVRIKRNLRACSDGTGWREWWLAPGLVDYGMFREAFRQMRERFECERRARGQL